MTVYNVYPPRSANLPVSLHTSSTRSPGCLNKQLVPRFFGRVEATRLATDERCRVHGATATQWSGPWSSKTGPAQPREKGPGGCNRVHPARRDVRNHANRISTLNIPMHSEIEQDL